MTKNYKIHAYNIIYDITEEDLDGVYSNTDELQVKLPHELHFEIAADECEEDLDDVVVDHISDLTGWMVQSFSYTSHPTEIKQYGPARYEIRFEAELTDEEVQTIEEYLWQTLYEQVGISAELIEVNLINNK